MQFPLHLSRSILANIHALCAEVFACLCYLLHEFGVRFRYIVKGKDTPAQTEEEVGAKGDESPEGNLS